MLCIHLVALGVFCLVGIRIVQQYLVIFKEREAAISPITLSLFKLSTWLGHFWYLLVLAVILLNGPLLFALHLQPRNRRWMASAWFVAVVVAFLLGTGFIGFVLTHQFDSLENG